MPTLLPLPKWPFRPYLGAKLRHEPSFEYAEKSGYLGPQLCSVREIAINHGMSQTNIQSEAGVALVGGGAIVAGEIGHVMSIAHSLVAADGGADRALADGFVPQLVIGDMDSISHDARRKLGAERLLELDEQESTDFEKCLSRIAAPFVLALGFTGPRLDHTLAVWSALARMTEAPPCFVLGERDVVFAAPAQRLISLDLARGTRVSLFPMAAISGTATGLRWPIEGLNFAPNGRIGTSNAATGRVEMRFDSAGMLVIVPRDCLEAAIAALVPAR